MHGDSYAVWRAADAALVKSGTSTLEAAIAGTPLIVAYRVGRLNYEIARRLIRGISYIGLVNLVVDRSVAPEFIQHEMQPTRDGERARAAARARLERAHPDAR